MILGGGELVRRKDREFTEAAPLDPGSNGGLYRTSDSALKVMLQESKGMQEKLKFLIDTGSQMSL